LRTAAFSLLRLLPALLLAVPGIACAAFTWNLPEPVTPMARDTYGVHNMFMVIIVTMFVVVFAVMLYSIARHRKSIGAKPHPFTHPVRTWQWVLVSVPFLILAFIDFITIGIPSVHALVLMEDTKSRAEILLKVTGMQWKWQYEYPDEGIRFVSTMSTTQDQIENREAKRPEYLLEVDNHVVLPVNRKVRVLLTSTDVIHTWWVPQFGVKRDAIPGFLRETWILIEKPGIYRGQCAELCGTGHAFMPVVVEAVSEPEYRAWIDKRKAEQAASAAGAERTWSMDELMKAGQEVYAKQCAVCHQANGQGLPPAFPGLVGSKLVTGPLLAPDGKLLKDGHVDRVLNGKPGTAMPPFRDTLSDSDLAAVITYERNAFGNKQGDMIQPAQIKALR